MDRLIPNKHLRNIINEYLLMKHPFEDELIKMTKLIFFKLYYYVYYPDHCVYDLHKEIRYINRSKIGRYNNNAYYIGQWAIHTIIN